MKLLPKNRTYPKKIYFRSEVYKLKFVAKMEHYGETDPERKEIRIKKGMSDRETFKTLVHELLHLVEFEAPIKIRHKMIYKLEEAISELLMDNFL